MGKNRKIKKEHFENFENLNKKFPNIIGYGSPAKATTKLNYFGINNTNIHKIVEDNKLKHNKIIPGINIEIVSNKHIKNKNR